MRTAEELAKQAELAYQKANKMTATLANQAKGQKMLEEGNSEGAQTLFETVRQYRSRQFYFDLTHPMFRRR